MTGFGRSIQTWAEMIKLSHSAFALPFALVATFLAARHLNGRRWPLAGQVLLVVWCMVCARSAAMTWNRIADLPFDARNPRTAGRALPIGLISLRTARFFLLVAVVGFVIGAYGFLGLYQNAWPLLLAPPVLLYLFIYSYTKRWTRWSHVYLGTSLALAPAAAWVAIDPASLGASVIVLMVTVTCWVAGFDIVYACQDAGVDRREGLHSLPARCGLHRALWIARAFHGLALCGLAVLGVLEKLGIVYSLGVGAAALLLMIQHWIVRGSCDRGTSSTILSLNGVLSLLVVATTLTDLALG